MPGGRFLLAAIDGGGTVPPTLGVAAELVRRGHQVRVLADPTIEPSARSAGCAFTPWRLAPHFDSLAEQTALLARMEAGNPLRQFRAARDLLICGPAPGFAQDVIDTVAAHPADVVVGEAAIPGILIGAQATRLPTAALMPNIYLRPTPGVPLFGTGWSPARGPLTRLRDTLGPKAFRRVWSGCLPAVNALLASHQLAPLGNLFQVLDGCTRVLVLTSPSFDFPVPQLPTNVRYVGPQLDDPDWASGDEAWQPEGQGPLVLVALSSIYQNQTDLLRRAATALGTLPVRAVVTTGRAIDPATIPAPPNVRVLTAAPHRRVLADAAAVLTHAGHGTLLKTLAAGVPVVCVPMGRDQKDNAVRAVRLGAGLRIPPTAGAERIAAAVSAVLTRPEYGQAAQRFAGVLAAEARDRPTAADEIEQLLVRS